MSIRVSCPQCKKNYQVPDSAAGKKGTCQKCGAVFKIPRTELSESPSGGHVLRHKAAAPFAAPKHHGRHLEAIEAHIALHIGEIETVFHELISDKVHLDVLVVPPNDKHNWYTLVTSGMSDLPMQGPGLDPADRYAELVLCLPATWPVSEAAFKDPRNYWPIEWLKRVARLPHEFQTWVGPGHTIPNGDPPQPFDASTEMCCWMITRPPWFPDEFRELEISSERTVNFMCMLPMHADEVAFKLQFGADRLVDRLDLLKLTDLMRFDRPNVCSVRSVSRLPLWLRKRPFTVGGAVLLAVLFLWAVLNGDLRRHVDQKLAPTGPQHLNAPAIPQPNLPPEVLEHQRRIEELRERARPGTPAR